MESTPPLRLEVRDDVAFIRLNDPGAEDNKLTPQTLAAFNEALDRIESQPGLRGVVITSDKPSFVVGADVAMLLDLGGPREAEALSRAGQQALDRLRHLAIPSVAAIHGAAMGGGLELALACTWRVATDDPSTRMALPEVRLGLCPGAGGTQYLPRLIGIQNALPLMLTGSNVYPAKARRLGLVDLVCPQSLLERSALHLLERHRRESHGVVWRAGRILEVLPPARKAIFREARRRARESSGGHYPAPDAIIDCVGEGYRNGIEAGLAAEAAAFGRLLATRTARALISLFLARGSSRVADVAAPIEVRRVGVLGAGLMGSGIAAVTAGAGIDVVVKDQSLELAAGAVHVVRRQAERDRRRGIVSAFERDARIARVRPAAEYSDLSTCELLIEAVPEDAELKRVVLRAAEDVLPEHAVLATNTSAIPLAMLAPALTRPERLVGMHYFSPVERMPLLEIVRQVDTSSEAVATAVSVGRKQDKTVIIVNDGPGFYTTRILAMYLNEALLLLEEGAAVPAVDEAMRTFGFPMGPFELLDLVGVDVAAGITRVLEPLLERRGLATGADAGRLVKAGVLGQKSGVGFYAYEDASGDAPPKRGVNRDRAIRGVLGLGAATPFDPSHLQDRLLLTMVGEAIRTLEDGVLRSPADGDIGAVFGLGFPPHTGGPFRYVDDETPQSFTLRMARLAQRHGARFEAPELLRRHSEESTRFHDTGRDA